MKISTTFCLITFFAFVSVAMPCCQKETFQNELIYNYTRNKQKIYETVDLYNKISVDFDVVLLNNSNILLYIKESRYEFELSDKILHKKLKYSGIDSTLFYQTIRCLVEVNCFSIAKHANYFGKTGSSIEIGCKNMAQFTYYYKMFGEKLNLQEQEFFTKHLKNTKRGGILDEKTIWYIR